MILTLRTDKPVAEIGLFTPESEEICYESWQAHRELEVTILQKIEDLLQQQKENGKQETAELTGIVVFAGPGSFTGLRIGHTVANALAWAKDIPNAQGAGEDWINDGLQQLTNVTEPQTLVPEYGSDPHITRQRK